MGERQFGSRLPFLPSGVIVLFAVSLCVNAVAQSPRTTYVRDHVAAIHEGYVTVEGLRLRYVESGSGPAVVMIHGNAGSIEDFEFGVIQFLSANYHGVAIDRPGHGKSDRPGTSATVEYQARLLHKVLATLGISEPVLIGHSWGAALALSYALQYPNEVSAMLLIAPAAYPDAGESRLVRAIAKPPAIGDVSLLLGRALLGRHILRQSLSRAFSPEPVPEEYFNRVASSWLGRKQLKAYLDDESSFNKSLGEISKHYAEIDIPVIIMTGDHDQIVSAKDTAYRLRSAIAAARLIEIKDSGHEIPQTHPQSIANALDLIGSKLIANSK